MNQKNNMNQKTKKAQKKDNFYNFLVKTSEMALEQSQKGENVAPTFTTTRRNIYKIKRSASRPFSKKLGNKDLKNTPGYAIELKDLTKYYKASPKSATRVLMNLNLSIKKGEFVVLFGKSGSGKSTLLNLMSGLDRPNKGDIIVLDKNLSYLNNHKLTLFRREHISFIFQQYHLLNNISGIDNVETGQYLQKDKNKHIDLDKMFENFDLLDVKNKLPSQMSGGQQQRISILRALAKNSEIIFADEPTGALDQKSGNIIMEELQKINQEQQKTIILVTHDPQMFKYATRIINLQNGIIISDELVANLNKNKENNNSFKNTNNRTPFM